MKTKNMIWAALSMTAALVMTACTNDDNEVETPAATQAEVKTIPYSVTVSQGGDATTRATVDDDMKTLHFAAGDKLYIKSNDRTDLKGILTLKSGDEGKTSGATFEGTISYTGEAPADDIWLSATLVGTSNENFYFDGDIVRDDSKEPSAYYADVKEAVEKYSFLTGMSIYGEKKFTLSQLEAFLNFEITFEDGTAENATLSTVVSNYGSALCTANVKTKKDGEKVVAKFVLPVIAGTTLSGATVKVGDKPALTINDATLDGKVYNVKRTYAPTLSLTSPAVGQVIGSDGKNYAAAATLPTGVTKVAMIAYVSGSNGLAIALADEGSLNWATAKSTCEAKTPAFTNGTWKLPSKAEWNQMFGDDADTDIANYFNLNTAISTAGGTELQDGLYWSSTEFEGDITYVELDLGSAYWHNNGYEDDDCRVRACLAF